jgi:hypothetical protein
MSNDVIRRLAAANPVPHDGPLHLPEPVRARLSSRPLVAVAVAAAALAGGGVAIAAGVGAFARPLHQATLVVSPNALTGRDGTALSTCSLLGARADRVAAVLDSRGITIQWRFMHWGTVTAATGNGPPTAVSGGRSDAVGSVPADSIVWDVVPDTTTPNSAFVFVEAPNDPAAPTLSTVNCGG